MASNSFGQIFKITTWGESHGKGIGVVIDGCPAGLAISEQEINQELSLRAPGKNDYTTPRQEQDIAQIYSGVFEGQTTGAPLSIVIHNKDSDSSKYEPIKDLLRPGHANFTYLEKYGIFDYRGGGRSSARETACRVAAGAVAKKLLAHFHIFSCAYIESVGIIHTDLNIDDIHLLQQKTLASPVYCPDEEKSEAIMKAIMLAKESGDSLGGGIKFQTSHLPIGLGDPVYEKLEANLAKAMLSLPATKGFEIGEGFFATQLSGSEHNDTFIHQQGKNQPLSNHAGGTLGGISTGQPLIGRVAFKPTSSIMKSQKTVNLKGEETEFKLPHGSRHDPCVAIRAVPIVAAMCNLVLADALLLNRCAKL
ncbi:MAG: chorismate synthase [Gammaproteobacteria bacterium RIFCSPHIGHO2_12_FULL_35_23]|nr:MAG: chorismate synthase [Gammaproteobacteria bacterium RIFCSPHIGHO2_12_FULL_35_23]